MGNKYFNEISIRSMNLSDIEKENISKIEINKLTNLNDLEIELLFTNPVIGVTANGSQIYRPINQTFRHNQEMIFAGCSQTHGDHIAPPLAKNGNHEQIWGFLVAKKMGYDAINLGVGAEGAYRIVQRLFGHFSYYGNPKTLLCLFPDMYRFISPKDDINMIAKRPYGTYKFLEGTFHAGGDVNDIPSFSKKPHKKEDVISPFVPIFYNIQAINMLEQYCKSSGINLIWGSWDPNTNRIIRTMRSHDLNLFRYYINLDDNGASWDEKECHLELYNKYPSLYAAGIDGQHMGMHRHAHIAETFIKKLNK